MRLFSSNKILKNTGLIKDQEGIFSRYMREKKNWKSHLEQTQSFISTCVEGAGNRSIAILGSGWCLDVPVETLANHFDKVCLFDIRHPSPVRKKYSRHKNVCFFELDLTGGMINEAFQLVNRKASSTEILQSLLSFPDVVLPEKYDFIASVNILNQLDILLLDYLKENSQPGPDKIRQLRTNIQERHLKLIQQTNSCIITDFEEVQIDKKDETIQKKQSLYVTIPEKNILKQWTWKFDTYRTYHPNYNTILNVLAAKFDINEPY